MRNWTSFLNVCFSVLLSTVHQRFLFRGNDINHKNYEYRPLIHSVTSHCYQLVFLQCLMLFYNKREPEHKLIHQTPCHYLK